MDDIIAEKEIDCSYTREVVCPYCGYEESDSWEIWGLDSDGDQTTHTCGKCEKDFKVTMKIEVTYISEKL